MRRHKLSDVVTRQLPTKQLDRHERPMQFSIYQAIALGALGRNPVWQAAKNAREYKPVTGSLAGLMFRPCIPQQIKTQPVNWRHEGF